MLETQSLSLTYMDMAGHVEALNDISLKIGRREFVCLVGPSGCGKSSLVRVLAGLNRPTNGAVFFDDVPLEQPTPEIGIVFQKATLMPWRTVQSNISLPLELAGVDRIKAIERAQSLIRLVGLAGFETVHPAALSGGMEQRVSIARALALHPKVLLLDEPFGALDALTRERMGRELLRIWSAEQTTVLMVTHSIPEAVFLSDRTLVMSQRPGRIMADITIGLPRPRKFDMQYNQAFIELIREIREMIGQD